MSKIKKQLMMIFVVFVNSNQLISQKLEIVDTVHIKVDNIDSKLFLYKRRPCFTKLTYNANDIPEFKKKIQNNLSSRNSFSSYKSNTVFTVVSKGERKSVHNVIFASDDTGIGPNIRNVFSGRFLSINKQLYFLLCRSERKKVTMALFEPRLKEVLGEFPEYFDTIDIADWPVPIPAITEINFSTISYVTNVDIAEYNNGVIIRTSEKKVLNKKTATFDYYYLDKKRKTWFKSILKQKPLNTDTSYHIPKTLLKKSPAIEKTPQANKIIGKISKELLDIKCDVLNIEAINEEKSILFFVSYKKRCKAVALRYDINEMEWHKVEFEETEIKKN